MKLIFKKLLGGIIPKFNPGGQTRRQTKKATPKRKLRLTTTNSSTSKPRVTYVERPNMFTSGTHREMAFNSGIKNLDERAKKQREYDDETTKLTQQGKYTEAKRRDFSSTHNMKELDRKKLREKDDWKKKHKGKTPLMSSLGEEEIKRRQQILADAGLYKGKIDGIWGDKSKAAQAEYNRLLANASLNKRSNQDTVNHDQASMFIDLFKYLGLSDDLVLTAVLKLPKNPIDRYGNLTPQCAAYVNKVLMDNGKFSKGDAPQVLKLFKTIYNGYNDIDVPDMSNFSHKDSVKTIVDLHHQAADNFAEKMDTTKLDRNHMYPVNMYYGRTPRRGDASPHTTDFYKAGIKHDTPGSHVGLVYSDPKRGWRVTHNIHGTIHDEPLTSVLGSKRLYGIIGMSDAGKISDEPLYKEYSWYDPRGWFKNGGILKAEYGIELPEISVTAISPNLVTSKSGKDFIRGLNSSRSDIMLNYDLSDSEYADLAKFALNIASRESKVGNSKSYKFKSSLPDWVINAGKIAKFRKPGARSLGYSQIKYEDDIKNPDLKKLYDENGITKDSIANDPQTMAKATVLRARFNDKQLFSNGKDYYYSDYSRIPKDTARAMYWNRGRLTSGANKPTSDLDAGGATGYARRFEHESLIP